MQEQSQQSREANRKLASHYEHKHQEMVQVGNWREAVRCAELAEQFRRMAR